VWHFAVGGLKSYNGQEKTGRMVVQKSWACLQAQQGTE
jgi:hypothetical protein